MAEQDFFDELKKDPFLFLGFGIFELLRQSDTIKAIDKDASTMTSDEIQQLYNQIENLSDSIIEDYVIAALPKDDDDCCGIAFDNNPREVYLSFKKDCTEIISQNMTRIREIIKNNPKSSKTIMDIVCLLAPTIAQQYTGFSGMAVVGTLTIICKQNLGL